MAWVYMVQCSDGSYYVGSTRNLGGRVDQHNSGRGARYTSSRLPVELIWAQEFERVDEAWEMEKRIQGWSRAKREALARGEYERLPGLSGSRYRRQGHPGR